MQFEPLQRLFEIRLKNQQKLYVTTAVLVRPLGSGRVNVNEREPTDKVLGAEALVWVPRTACPAHAAHHLAGQHWTQSLQHSMPSVSLCCRLRALISPGSSTRNPHHSQHRPDPGAR